jgi:lysozyme
MNPYIRDILILDEGLRLKPYKDSVGLLTIGIGRCLDTTGISMDECEYLFKNDTDHIEAQAQSFSWYAGLDEVRQAVVLSMLFNLGLRGFQKFVNTIKFIETRQYEKAAYNMLQSKWAKQVGKRAYRLAEMMRTGTLVRR